MSDRMALRRTAIRMVAVAVLAVGAMAIYLSLDLQGNRANAACTAAAAEAERLDAYATGQVAAFRITAEPALLADLAFRDADGNDLTIADLAGKTVLINFWATWCVPCREEMPALDRLAATMAGDDTFTVLAINTLETSATRGRSREFLDEIGVTLAYHTDANDMTFNELRRRSLATGLPTTILVDGNGCTLGIVEGPADWAGPDALALIRAALAG